jgi:hypothetical protein
MVSVPPLLMVIGSQSVIVSTETTYVWPFTMVQGKVGTGIGPDPKMLSPMISPIIFSID